MAYGAVRIKLVFILMVPRAQSGQLRLNQIFKENLAADLHNIIILQAILESLKRSHQPHAQAQVSNPGPGGRLNSQVLLPPVQVLPGHEFFI